MFNLANRINNNDRIPGAVPSAQILMKENAHPGKVDCVALPVFEKVQEKKAEPGVLERLARGVIGFGLRVALPMGRERDEKILRVILSNDKEPMELIEDLSPQLHEFIIQMLDPGFAKDLIGGQADSVKDILLRIFTNLSLDLLPEEEKQRVLAGEALPLQFKISSDQLIEKITTRMLNLIGTELNEIDKAVHNKPHLINNGRFKPLAEKIYSRIFPPGDGYRLFEGKCMDWMSEKFKEGYLFCFDFLDVKEVDKADAGNEDPIDFQPLEKGITRFGAFLKDWLNEKWFEKDRQFFKELTGGEVGLLAEKISPELYKKILKFLPEGLKKIVEDGKNPEAIDQITQSFVLHAFACISKDVFSKEIERGEKIEFEEVLRKINTHLMEKIKIIFEEVKQKELAGEVIAEDHFAEHSEQFMHLFLPNAGEYEWLDCIFARRKLAFTRPVNEVLFSIYQAQPNEKSLLEYKQRMRELLWDRNMVRASGGDGIVPQVPNEVDARCAGIEDTIDQIYNLASNLAEMSADGIAGLLNNPHKIIGKYFALEGDPIVEDMDQELDPHVDWASKQIKKALEITFFKGMVHLFEKVPQDKRHPPENLLIHSLQSILKLCVEHFPTVSEQLENEKAKMREEITHRFSQIGSKDYIGNLEERQAAIEKELEVQFESKGADLLVPFVDEFLSLLFETHGITFEEALPLPKKFQASVGEYARKGIAQAFSGMMIVATSWMRERKKNEENLDELYHSKNPHKLCNVLGHMARAGIPWVFQEQGDQIVEDVILPSIEPFLRENGAPEIEKGNLGLVLRMLKGLFESVAHDQSPEMETVFGFIGVFTETTLLKMVSDFSKRLKTMEEVHTNEVPFTPKMDEYKNRWLENAPDPLKNKKGDVNGNRRVIREIIQDKEIKNDQMFAFFKFAKIKADGRFLRGREELFKKERKMDLMVYFESYEKSHTSLLEDTALGIMDLLATHFNGVGKAKEKLHTLGKKEDRAELINQLKEMGRLHPAIADEEENDKFFQQWAADIFKIIGVNKEGPIPIPELIKEGGWDAIKDKLIPLLLKLMFDAGRKPSNLNKVLVSILQDSFDSAKQDKNSFLARLFPDDDEWKERLEELEPRFKDGYQEELEKKIGDWLEALIHMQPNKMPRLLINFATIKAKASAAIGQPLRSFLRLEDGRPRSCLELIEKGMSYVDSIVEVEWDEEKGCVVYPKTEFDGRKAPAVNDVVEYVDKPNLDRFFPQTKQEKDQADALEKSERERAEEEVPKYMRFIMAEQTRQVVVKLFSEKWDRLEAKIRKKYPKMSKWIIPLLAFIVKLPGLLTVYFLDLFVWSIVNSILKLILFKEIDGHAKNVQLDIHDNGLYHMIDHVMKKYVNGIDSVYVDDVPILSQN